MMGSETQPVLLRRQSGARSQSYPAGRARRKSGGEGGGGVGEGAGPWRRTQMEDVAVADGQGTQFRAPVGRD